jgi:DUF4097 and DUF4098 domain-containing protein YvlB
VVACTAWLLCPASTRAARRDFNLNVSGDVETCADVKATTNDGEIARFSDTLTFTRAEAPTLEINAGDRSHIWVRGWDRADYSVETCKLAVAENRTEAERLAKGIAVTRAGGRLSFNGPASDSGQWTAILLIHAPKDAALNLETKNGPLEVRGMTGTLSLRAANGPIEIRDCGGRVEAHTVNGPIAFSGDRGDVHLQATNGPIALNLPSADWSGPRLEARTINGPLAVSLPETFRTGMRLDTAGRAPFACSAAPCRTAVQDAHTMHMNGSSDVIQLSTENGPVSIHTSKAGIKAKVF